MVLEGNVFIFRFVLGKEYNRAVAGNTDLVQKIDNLSALLPAVNLSINEKLVDVQQEIVMLDRKV